MESQPIGEHDRSHEQIGQAAFSLTINKELLAHIELPQRDRDYAARIEDVVDPSEMARRELEATLEHFMRLPDRLDFLPGVTRIIGPNRSGKTVLNRAFFYAARLHEEMEELGNEEGAEEIANENVFNPPLEDTKRATKISNAREWLIIQESQLAVRVSGAITVNEFQSGVPVRFYVPHLEPGIYFGREMERMLHAEDEARKEMNRRDVREEFKIPTMDIRSHSQTITGEVFEQIKTDQTYDNEKPTVYFIDEVEAGMDVKRQRELIDELKSFANPGSIIILSTNLPPNQVRDDTPTIDLEYPERGIHNPLDFVEPFNNY